jgi:hypothetical protein
VAPAPAPSGAELGDETAAGEGHDLQQQPQAAPPAAERSPGNSNTRLPSASASTHQVFLDCLACKQHVQHMSVLYLNNSLRVNVSSASMLVP